MKKLFSADKLMKALRDRQCTNALIDTVEHEISYMTDDLTIPENPTNGDIITAMFPQLNVNEEWKATRHFEFKSEECIEITGIATSDWWNAPYERSTDDNG